ncbi:MAG: DUF499 domain-containing protein [candidate division WOR-3 bacterium]
MEPWYKVATPRKELREGRSLDPSEFAVHLDQIVSGRAPDDYKNPEQFFGRTYFTKALVTDYCGKVLRRLAGETSGTAPVLSMLTQFGGGKTHTLAALYHLAKSGPAAQAYPGVPELLSAIGLKQVPKARVAVFVGNSWDQKSGSETPWIDVAVQLAGDAGRKLIGEDFKQRAPGTEVLEKLFALVDAPILFLFDETLNFIGRYGNLATQFHSFLQNLTTALTARQNAVGVFSLPASPTEMTDELCEWQIKLSKLTDRVGQPLLANDPEEISEIVRRRLFEDPGRKSMQQAAARQYARWVFERRDRLPAEFANFGEEVIRKRFEACYPFHPSTLTVFQRKWASLPSFQQTRGTLVMLGMWIAIAAREGYACARREPLITLGSAPLSNREFRSKVLEQMGETRLEHAINYDISGENAVAVALDKELSDTVGRTNLHQRVATALLFESCGGMVSDKVATLSDLRFALGDAETETTLVDTAVQALVSRCYYLRPVGTGGWKFGCSPTLRKIHADRKAGLNPADVEKQTRAVVTQVFRKNAKIEAQFFPKDSAEVSDRPVLRLVVGTPDSELDQRQTEQLNAWTVNCGQSPRQYPGAVLWVMPESATGLQKDVADWMAWTVIADEVEAGSMGELEPHEQQMARTEVKKAYSRVEERVWSLYSSLLYWDAKAGSLQKLTLGMMHPSEARGITGAILSRMRQANLLNREIGPTYVERKWPQALKKTGAWSLASLKAAFFQGSLTRLERADEALLALIQKAVPQGALGMGVGKDELHLHRIWFRETVDPAEVKFDHETFLLLPERAKVAKAGTQTGGVTEPGDIFAPPGGDTTVIIEPPKPEAKTVQPTTVEWRGNIPRDMWNLLSHRVLARLAGADGVEIEVFIKAKLKDPAVRQQLNAALRELRLGGEFTVQD